MPDFKPYLVIGLALGGVYAMSGVGLVVLFRTTGVFNLFYGAVGALGVARRLHADQRSRAGTSGCRTSWRSCSAGVLTLLYGWLLGPPLADRDPLVKASASLGFALILLGFMQWRWTADVRSLALPTDRLAVRHDGWLRINWTQAIGMIFPIVVAVAHRRCSSTAARSAPRCGRSPTTATTRRCSVCRSARSRPSAWFGSGVVFGVLGPAAREPRLDGDRRPHVHASRSPRWPRR